MPEHILKQCFPDHDVEEADAEKQGRSPNSSLLKVIVVGPVVWIILGVPREAIQIRYDKISDGLVNTKFFGDLNVAEKEVNELV